MAYRKLAATMLFDGYRFHENKVLVIEEDGRIEALVPATEAGADVEQYNGILTPGFINCHCHLELSHMKGKIPEKTGLVDFVFKVVTQRGATEVEISEAIAAAESEMKKAGIVAVGDICNNSSTLAQKQKGNLQYYNFIEASGWLPAVSTERFERAKQLYEAFTGEWSMVNGEWPKASGKPAASQLQTPDSKPQTPNCSIVPHAPYSVSENLWQAIQPYFAGKVVSIHNQETRFEDEFFMEGTGDLERMYALMKIDNSHHRPTGLSSIQSYYDKLDAAKKIILVHNTFTKKDDIDWLQSPILWYRPETFFCLCVNANLYIEDALPPIEMLRTEGCNLVLGTDSLASNWSLRILDEIKTIRQHFPKISLEEILGWATSNGAKALGIEDRFGSFDMGKKPGVVLIDPLCLEVGNVLA